MGTADNGVAVIHYAPALARIGTTTVDVESEYPFEDSARITITAKEAVSVQLRIPSWASSATVNGKRANNGTMWSGHASAGVTTFRIDFNPKIRLEEWDKGAVSVHRGALMYSLPISANYTVYGHHFGDDDMASDYYLTATSPWQFALDVDPKDYENKTLTFATTGYVKGAAPFNHSNWPSTIDAAVRPLPSWGLDKNSAADPPTSPACSSAPCGRQEHRQLVPHGGTDLRIGELPLASHAGIAGEDEIALLI